MLWQRHACRSSSSLLCRPYVGLTACDMQCQQRCIACSISAGRTAVGGVGSCGSWDSCNATTAVGSGAGHTSSVCWAAVMPAVLLYQTAAAATAAPMLQFWRWWWWWVLTGQCPWVAGCAGHAMQWLAFIWVCMCVVGVMHWHQTCCKVHLARMTCHLAVAFALHAVLLVLTCFNFHFAMLCCCMCL